MVLVLYYIEYVQAHVTKTLIKNVLDGGLICGMGKCATSLTTLLPPFTTSTAYARGVTMTPSGGMQTTMPPLPLSLSPHTCCRHCLHLWAQVKLCFFLLFCFFSDHCRDLFSPHARFSNPPPLHHALPLKPTSPTTTIALFVGTQVKLCFFSSFFHFFSDQCCRDLFSPHAGFSNPPPLHCASPLKPCKSHCCHCPICGHTSKVMFISFLFFVPSLTTLQALQVPTTSLHTSCDLCLPPLPCTSLLPPPCHSAQD